MFSALEKDSFYVHCSHFNVVSDAVWCRNFQHVCTAAGVLRNEVFNCVTLSIAPFRGLSHWSGALAALGAIYTQSTRPGVPGDIHFRGIFSHMLSG